MRKANNIIIGGNNSVQAKKSIITQKMEGNNSELNYTKTQNNIL